METSGQRNTSAPRRSSSPLKDFQLAHLGDRDAFAFEVPVDLGGGCHGEGRTLRV
jgi:hypothetical protein